jgi:predicted aspartyl protease
MSLRFACFLVLVTLASSSVTDAQIATGTPAHAVTIPFEHYDNLIFVDVQVNGSAPQRFLLDSGASTSFLSETLADSFGLGPKHKHQMNVGAGESSASLGFAHDVTLNLSGIGLPAQTVAVVSFGNIEARIGHKIAGIVGADLFKRYIVTIDYAASQLVVSDPDSLHDGESGEVFTLRLSGNRPFLQATIIPVSGPAIQAEFVVDTGDTSTVTFHTPFVEKYALRSGQILVPHQTTGISGDSQNWRGRIKQLQLGKCVLDHPIATFSGAQKGSEADASYSGVLGGEVLGRFRVTMDYPHHRMYLEPNSHLADPYEDDMSGATLLASGPDLQSIVVLSVMDGSAASEAGIKPNDILETIDGKMATDMTLQQIKQMFMRDGAAYSVQIRRAGELVHLTLQLRRRI